MATGSMVPGTDRTTSVNETMGHLACAVQELSEKIMYLHDKLVPVMSAPPDNKTIGKAIASKNCELAGKIEGQASSIEECTDKIRAIMERLEI